MQTKIAFFDIDGTLIDIQSKRITEKTLEALQRLRAGGVKICLATGRSRMRMCRKLLPTAQPSGGLSVCRGVTGWPPTARTWT